MVSLRSRRVLVGLTVVVATLVVASPANASASATYGSLTSVAPTVAACSGATCMTTSASFASNGTVSTNVTVSIALYRTARAGATAASSSDYLVKSSSTTYSTVKGSKSTWTLTATQKCATVATTAYGYYTRATITNGTVAGTVSESSAIKQLKGCVTA